MVYLRSRHVQLGKDILIHYGQVEGFQGSKERKKQENEQLKQSRKVRKNKKHVGLFNSHDICYKPVYH